MELYNSLINRVEKVLEPFTPRSYAYDEAGCWAETRDFELVMARETAYELGGSSLPALSFSCVTSGSALVDRDEVCVYGPDLSELNSDSAYARITLLRVGDIASDDENDTETAFRAIQNIDFVRYRVFPKGYMMRTSSESGREQVRISRSALKSGLDFQKLGNLFIKHYHQDPNVLNVRIVFVTLKNADYAELAKIGRTVHDVTMSLSQILKGLPQDCGSCNLKNICDEVEGMKELHFGKK